MYDKNVRDIAFSLTNDGEIVNQEFSSDGLWNEYQYTIVNGDIGMLAKSAVLAELKE